MLECAFVKHHFVKLNMKRFILDVCILNKSKSDIKLGDKKILISNYRLGLVKSRLKANAILISK